jgi:hypothetical protein
MVAKIEDNFVCQPLARGWEPQSKQLRLLFLALTTGLAKSFGKTKRYLMAAVVEHMRSGQDSAPYEN